MNTYQVIETSIYFIEAENADEAQAKFDDMKDPFPSKVYREFEVA